MGSRAAIAIIFIGALILSCLLDGTEARPNPASGSAQQPNIFAALTNKAYTCDDVKCYGQNKCEMVEIPCGKATCEMQPLCSLSLQE